MARERPAVCIDASVAAKWFLADEDHRRGAQELLSRFVQGKLDILVPELFFYEIGNLMLMPSGGGGCPKGRRWKPFRSSIACVLRP